MKQALYPESLSPEDLISKPLFPKGPCADIVYSPPGPKGFSHTYFGAEIYTIWLHRIIGFPSSGEGGARRTPICRGRGRDRQVYGLQGLGLIVGG